MKKLIVFVLTLALVFSMFACATAAPATEEPAQEATATEAPAAEATEAAATTIYIPVISKGFQHKFWQTVMLGSQDAAAKYGVEITFDGPPSESDISTQVGGYAECGHGEEARGALPRGSGHRIRYRTAPGLQRCRHPGHRL